MTDFTIAHISDLHLVDRGHDVTLNDGHELVDSLEAESPDIIIDTGDHTGSGLARQFEQAEEVTSRLADIADYYLTTANHDVSIGGSSTGRYTRGNWESYAERVDTSYEAGSQWPRVIDRDGLRLILIDTCAEPTLVARGHIGDEQLRRIGIAVAEARGRGMRTILAGHHCLSADARGLDRTLYLTDRDALAETLREAGGVDLGLFGHLHRKAHWSDVLGFRRLVACPMSTRDGGWWHISWDTRGFFGVGWASVT